DVALRVGRLVGELDQARRVVAPLADRRERSHPGRTDVVRAERLEAKRVEAAGGLLGPFGETRRGTFVWRRVDEIPATVRPPGDDVCTSRLLGHRVRLGPAQ